MLTCTSAQHAVHLNVGTGCMASDLCHDQVIFRCDMLPLIALIGLHMLASRQISLQAGLLTGLTAGAACLVLTVVVDSWFWQRWLWPEGEVLWFNTAQNRFALL